MMISVRSIGCVRISILVVGLWTSIAEAVPLSHIPLGNISIQLTPIATGLAAPDYGISAPGDTNRLFVVEQNGLLRVIQNGALLSTPALDIQSRVSPPLVTSNPTEERGFLGLAFHPGFNDPLSPGYRTLYTYSSQPVPVGSTPTYPTPNGASTSYENAISEWKMSTSDPNVVDATSRRELISFGKNASNHNGGTIAFGPDGYLYLGTGDGGNANDVGASHVAGGNAQNLGVALGKMLRIDPLLPTLNAGTSTDPTSSNGQYRIPASNPFQGVGQVPEIFAYGFRNPYRFSFDSRPGGTNDLIVADVGQNTIEEIDRVTIGKNYGWNTKEGTFLFNSSTGAVGANSPGSPANLTDPIVGTLGTLEYDHGDGISITGGFVYRGSIPQLYGKYIFGDLALTGSPSRVDGRLFYADLTTGLIKSFLSSQFDSDTLADSTVIPVLANNLTIHGFGQDSNGELYLMVTNTAANGTGGIVYKLSVVPEPATSVLAITAVGWLVSRRRRQTPR
jgi:glucose/arabinose dehydrogenase